MRYLKNISDNDLFHEESGTSLIVGVYVEVDDNIIHRYNNSQMWNWINSGYIVYSEDEIPENDITEPYEVL